MKFLLSNNPDKLAEALKGSTSATVEAEYGERCVPGTVVTLAHHGSRSQNPAPCLASNGIGEGVNVVGLSHVDLDSLGGCLAILGQKPESESFWQLAAAVDVKGAHKLASLGASAEDLRKLYAFWSFSESNRIYPPRDGSVLDVTDKVLAFAEVISKILAGDPVLLSAGETFRQAGEKLASDSFRGQYGLVVCRESESFVNHLYTGRDVFTGRDDFSSAAVVARNSKTGSITVSLADPVPGISCRSFVQKLWGPEAGGHDGIAGSPRNVALTIEECHRTASLFAVELARVLGE